MFDKIDLDHFKSIETRPLLELLKQTYFEQYARDKNLFKKSDHIFRLRGAVTLKSGGALTAGTAAQRMGE